MPPKEAEGMANCADPSVKKKDYYLSQIMRKSVFWVSGSQTQTRLHSHRRWIEACNFGFEKLKDCTIFVAKTKVLIS